MGMKVPFRYRLYDFFDCQWRKAYLPRFQEIGEHTVTLKAKFWYFLTRRMYYWNWYFAQRKVGIKGKSFWRFRT